MMGFASLNPSYGMEAPVAASRDKIVNAFLALLAEKPFEKIGVAAVAARAEVSLADLRAEFGSTFDMLAAFARDTDQQVLANLDKEVEESTPRDRLFDVLMRRFEALREHRGALRSLVRSARRDPVLALGLNKLAVRSQQWMLAAAGIDSAGALGHARAQALALLYTNAMRTFLDDDDPDLARTMAALDREMARAESLARFANELCRLLPRCPPRRRRREEPEEPAEAAVA
jgi:AcrR family transcriptional regulator